MNKNKRLFISSLVFLLFSLSSMSQLIDNSSMTNQLKFMGIPLYSHINDYKKVLEEHRFKPFTYEYFSWEDGDFWKQKKCHVYTYRFKDNDFVYHVTVTIPFSNFKNFEDYKNTTFDLINDYTNKYGNYEKNLYDMEKHHTPILDVDFYAHDHGGDTFYTYSWKLPEGTIDILYNSNRQWSIVLRYISIEKNKRDEATSKFKGKGSSDL